MNSIDLNTYFYGAMVGGVRGVVGLPLEHPLDVLKTRMQAKITLAGPALGRPNEIQTVKEIMSTRGFSGFYTGAIPNTARICVKHAYRTPLNLVFRNFYTSKAPADLQKKYPLLKGVFTGITMACFETFIITPFERLKVQLITATKAESRSIRNFFTEKKGHLSEELMRGLRAVFLKQVVTWVTFRVSDDYFRDREKRIQQTNTLPLLASLKVHFYTGAINTAAILPFDIVKTLMQQDGYIQEKKIIPTVNHIVRTHGVGALCVGWRPRLIQYMIQAAYMDLLDRKGLLQ